MEQTHRSVIDVRVESILAAHRDFLGVGLCRLQKPRQQFSVSPMEKTDAQN
jgi:hypothetical protein